MERFDILLNSFEDVCVENTIQDALYTADIALECSLIEGASESELVIVAENVLKDGATKAKAQLQKFYNYLKEQLDKLIDWIKVWMTKGSKLFTKFEARIKKAYADKKNFKYKGVDFTGFEATRDELIATFTTASADGIMSEEDMTALEEKITAAKEKYKEKNEVALPALEEVKKVLTGKAKDIEALNKTKKTLKEAFDKAIKGIKEDGSKLGKEKEKDEESIEANGKDLGTAKKLKKSASSTVGFLVKYTKTRASQYESAIKKLLTGKAEKEVADKEVEAPAEENVAESLGINDGEFVIETAFGYAALEDVLESVSVTASYDDGCNENVAESILAGFRNMIR